MGHSESREGRGPKISIGGRRIPMPRSRMARVAAGVSFLLMGTVGFLPIVGFWMLPVGLIILSYDIAVVRRWRRRMEVWWYRRRETR